MTNLAFPLKREVDLKPETVALIQQCASFESFSIQLKTPEDRIAAADQLAKLKGLSKSVDEARSELKKPFDEAGKEIQSHFKPGVDALATAENILKSAMIAYDQEAERQQRLAEARAEEEARKQREKLEQQAEAAREKGKDEKADALEQNAATIAAAPVELPKFAPVTTKGTSTRKTYSAEVTDLLALVKAVAEGRAPIALIQPDMSALNKMAVALKESFDGQFPGVKLSVASSLSQRSTSPFKG